MLKLITRVTAIVGATVLLLASPALAGTITQPPPPGPFLVPGDAAGNPQAFTVVASGFPPNSPVLVEQCDGIPATTPGWDPTLNCDLVSSPSAAIADANGVATFPTTDPNRRFTPFKGESPQSIFNCLAPGQASPNNGLPDFTNCKIRVSSNNSAVTADQAFLPITLPGAAVETPPTPQNQAATVGVGATATLTLSATSTDATPVTDYQLTSLPAAGSLTVNGAAAVINTPYAPNNGSSLDVVYTAPCHLWCAVVHVPSAGQRLRVRCRWYGNGHDLGRDCAGEPGDHPTSQRWATRVELQRARKPGLPAAHLPARRTAGGHPRRYRSHRNPDADEHAVRLRQPRRPHRRLVVDGADVADDVDRRLHDGRLLQLGCRSRPRE